jgi:hypothetical protein
MSGVDPNAILTPYFSIPLLAAWSLLSFWLPAFYWSVSFSVVAPMPCCGGAILGMLVLFPAH